MKSWKKDPDSKLDYTVDWTSWLTCGETISTSSWVVETGVTQVSTANTNYAATIWLSGGTAGNEYTVTNRITTSAGRIEDRSFVLFVRER